MTDEKNLAPAVRAGRPALSVHPASGSRPALLALLAREL